VLCVFHHTNTHNPTVRCSETQLVEPPKALILDSAGQGRSFHRLKMWRQTLSPLHETRAVSSVTVRARSTTVSPKKTERRKLACRVSLLRMIWCVCHVYAIFRLNSQPHNSQTYSTPLLKDVEHTQNVQHTARPHTYTSSLTHTQTHTHTHTHTHTRTNTHIHNTSPPPSSPKTFLKSDKHMQKIQHAGNFTTLASAVGRSLWQPSPLQASPLQTTLPRVFARTKSMPRAYVFVCLCVRVCMRVYVRVYTYAYRFTNRWYMRQTKV